MSMWDEVELFTKLSGRDGEHTPIGIIGSFLDGYDKGKEDATKWIPCSERLPEKPFGCLVTVWDSAPTGEGDDFENVLPYFVGWDGEQWNDGDGEQCPFEVIAWMPLPEPYKADMRGEHENE